MYVLGTFFTFKNMMIKVKAATANMSNYFVLFASDLLRKPTGQSFKLQSNFRSARILSTSANKCKPFNPLVIIFKRSYTQAVKRLKCLIFERTMHV